jgi:uncharacterized protein YacL
MVVTSALQTSAGHMVVFARPRREADEPRGA